MVLNDRAASRLAEESRYADPRRPSDGGDAKRAEARWRTTGRICRVLGIGHTPSILDIGCGLGSFLALARHAGARVAGVEIDPRAVHACRAAGLEVVEGSIADVIPPAGPWDLVTFWDVLDHLDDPAGALRRVTPLLARRGAVLIRGRNGCVHVPLKRLCLRARRLLPFCPDPAVVHRFGITPAGYGALLRGAGFGDARLHPNIPPLACVLPSVLATGRLTAEMVPIRPAPARAAGLS